MACTPATICYRPDLQSPAMQQYLLLQVLCAAANALGAAVTCTAAGYQDMAADYLCQGSPAAINAQAAANIIDQLVDVDTTQPVCLTPSELAGAQAYLVCTILEQLAVV